MKIHSVRARLTFWNVGVMALMLAGFAVTLHYLVQRNLLSAIDEDLSRRVDWERAFHEGQMRRRVQFPGPPSGSERRDRGPRRGRRDRPDRRDTPARPAAGPPAGTPRRDGRQPLPPRDDPFEGIRKALNQPAAFDYVGRPIVPWFSPAPWSTNALARSLRGGTVLETTSASGTPIRLFSKPIIWQGEVIGVIQVIRPLGEMELMIRRLDNTLLMMILPALFLVGLSAAFLTDRSLRPVKRFSDATTRLTRQDLSQRLPVEGHDEFTELSANFNEMAERLEEAFLSLNRTNADLKEAYERQRRFAADASHELRTPLTTILANTSLALSGEESLEVYREALDEANTAAIGMKRTVDDLLFLARSDNDGLRLDARTLPVADVIEGAVAEANRQRRGTPVAAVVPDRDLTVTGDPHHLRRLILNLAENAIRHTPPDGSIAVIAEARGDSVVIRVEDTGEGIAPEHLPRLFDRFYRVDTARSREEGGAGLGLSICRSIAQAHGGTIAIESRPGEGTTVTVTLPNGPGAGDPGDGARQGRESDRTAGESGGVDRLAARSRP